MKVRLVNSPSPAQIAWIDNGAQNMLNRMMRVGVRVDRDALSDLAAFLTKRQQQITEKASECVGREFNPGSPQQVAQLLFHELRVQQGRKLKQTPTGQDMTGKLEIEKYVDAHPIVSMILDHRSVDKIRGTYAVPLARDAVRQPDGTYRIYTKLKPCATDTGRLAGEDPNLMNIPTRTEIGRKIKACFVPSIGKRAMEIDWSQIEMRVAAHLSGARRMTEVFFAKGDIHTETAMAVYKLPKEQVHETLHRYPMKRTGFGVLYLITAKGLIVQLNSSDSQDPANPHMWTEEEGAELIENWYIANPEIRDMQEEIFTQARRYGKVWTLFGRVRLVPEVRSALSWVRDAGLRQAANCPIQGTAADMLRMALARLDAAYSDLRAGGVGVEALVPIHDAVLAEADEDYAEDVARLTRDIMEDGPRLNVPIIADAKIAPTSEIGWAGLVSLDKKKAA